MKKYIFALGFFDGVHLGHQELLKACCRLATKYHCIPAAITFDRHPKSLFTDKPTVLISTVPDRERLLRRYGMERVKLLTVTRQTMGQPWRDFARMLVEDGAAGFVCGDDFRFGDKGAGDARKLMAFCQEEGLPCAVIPEQSLGDIRISSTYIRRRIELGDMAAAVRFLGHPYTLTGTGMPGRQPCHRLGIPTACLHLPSGLAIPRFGSYACSICMEGKRYPAVANIGPRSADADGVTVEVWILDSDEDPCGRELTIAFYKFLRPEQPFSSPEALEAEIRRNGEETRKLIQREFT